MTKEELAAILDGRQYGHETTREIEQIAEDNNLVIVFGYSDDLCEFRGAIYDEFDCYDGGIADFEGLPEMIEAVWCPPEERCSWAYKTDMPHSEFKIYEDDELYCIGIVIDLNEAREKPTVPPSPETVAKEMLAASQKDLEKSHMEMDEIMAKTLEALGYKEAIKIFKKTAKCYV